MHPETCYHCGREIDGYGVTSGQRRFCSEKCDRVDADIERRRLDAADDRAFVHGCEAMSMQGMRGYSAEAWNTKIPESQRGIPNLYNDSEEENPTAGRSTQPQDKSKHD